MKTSGIAVWYALAVLFAVNTLNFFDRLIIAAVGEPIRKEFGLTDASLGALSTAFVILYAFVGVPFGRLADTFSRRKILAAGVFVWSLLTAGSGLAQSFWQMFALRLGVGVGEASCAPAATSLIADLFPSSRRGKAISVFMLGLPVGIALSFAVSGTVTKNYGWRAAFLVAAAPGILVAIAALFLKEPVRGSSEMHDVGQDRRESSPYRLILASPTMRWLIVSGILHNFCLYALSSFLTPLLMRFYGLDIQNAGFAAMMINGILTIPGLLLGGIVGDRANKWRVNGALIVVTVAVLAAIPFFILALGVPGGSIYLFLALLGTGFALMYFYYAIVYATIQDINEPSVRGTAISVYFLAMYLLGGALGPYVVGLISDFFTKRAAISAGVIDLSQNALEPFKGEGLHSAMYVIPVLCIFLAGVLFAASRTVKKEIEVFQT